MAGARDVPSPQSGISRRPLRPTADPVRPRSAPERTRRPGNHPRKALESYPQPVTRLKSSGFCAVRIFVEKFAYPVLTAFGEVLITPLNDGGAAAGDEILRPPAMVGLLKKGLAKWFGKVLKVDSFGETEGTLKPAGATWAYDVGPASGSLTTE